MTELTRHFTATTFIVHSRSVLLHRHPRQNLWLPPGGHIERDELPHEAALREIEEETGLRVHLHTEQEAQNMSVEMACEVIPQPAFILVEDINPFHQHIDFVYFARHCETANRNSALPAAGQQSGFAWFTLDDLDMPDVPRNVRVGAERAISFFAAAQTQLQPVTQ